MVDDFNFLSGWARVKGNPPKVRVAVGAVLLEANLRPGCHIVGIDGIPITGPCSANVACDLAGWQASQTSHRDESGVEFTARSLFERFQHIERHIHWAAGPRAIEIALEFSGAVSVDDEVFKGKRRAVGIGGPGVADDAKRDVPHVGVFGRWVREPCVLVPDACGRC